MSWRTLSQHSAADGSPEVVGARTAWGTALVEAGPSTAWGRATVAEDARCPPEVVPSSAWGRVREADATAAAADTAMNRRSRLDDAVTLAYGGDGGYAWVRDFVEDLVWFDAAAKDETSLTWEQSYAVDDDGVVTLTGEREQVTVIRNYVPADRPVAKLVPADATNTTTEAGRSRKLYGIVEEFGPGCITWRA